MKNKGKIISFAAAVLLAASFMSGCSGSDKLLDKNDPVTVTIWHYYNGVQQTQFDKLVKEFNDTVGMEKGIIVEAFSKNSISELSQSVLAAVNGDVGADPLPDIFASYSETAYIVDKAGMLSDISRYLTAEEIDEYIPEYIEEGRFSGDGSLKIFPTAKSTEVMILNKTDWDKFTESSGVTVDSLSTWEGIVQTSEKYYEYTDSLTPDVPNDGKAFFGRDSVANYMIIGAKQLGSEFIRRNDSGEISLNIDKDVVKRLWENYYVPYVSGYFTAQSRFRSDDAKTGAIIALICSTTGSSYYPTEVTLNDDYTYPIENIVLPVPNFEGTEPYIVQQGAGMCTVKSEERNEYASVQFLKWFTESERNIDFSVNSGYLPVKKEANSFEKIMSCAEKDSISKIMEDTMKTAIDEINTGVLYTSLPSDNTAEVRDFLGNYIHDSASSDHETVEERISSGEDRAAVIGEYTSDSAFEKWFESFKSGLEQAAAGNV